MPTDNPTARIRRMKADAFMVLDERQAQRRRKVLEMGANRHR